MAPLILMIWIWQMYVNSELYFQIEKKSTEWNWPNPAKIRPSPRIIFLRVLYAQVKVYPWEGGFSKQYLQGNVQKIRVHNFAWPFISLWLGRSCNKFSVLSKVVPDGSNFSADFYKFIIKSNGFPIFIFQTLFKNNFFYNLSIANAFFYLSFWSFWFWFYNST